MARALLAALITLSAAAFAQTPPATPDATAKPAAPAATPAPAENAAADAEAIRKEVDAQVKAKLEEAKAQLREELRAELAAAALPADAAGWTEAVTPERRKLELFELDGYFRARPDLFYKFDLGRAVDPSRPAATLWPLSPASPREHTIAGVNSRVRLEPTLNVSEEVRLRMQVDLLDNLVWGSSPEYAFSRNGRDIFGILTETQMSPQSGVNAAVDSILVRRAYGEVSTPVGIFRFGRMGSHWGLGMLYNDGNCFDCDYGDTVDRLQFVTEPLAGWFIAPMIDFNSEGPLSAADAGPSLGQPFDRSQQDDAHTWVLAVARRDTDQQLKAKLENNQTVLNGGLHLSYRTQGSESVGAVNNPNGGIDYQYVSRGASYYIADAWVKLERKAFRLELEFVGTYGNLGSARSVAEQESFPDRRIQLWQHGAVLQGEYRLLDNKLRIGGEVGYASGDRAPGLGNHMGRPGSGAGGVPVAGDIDGAQFYDDQIIRNFRFDRDYRVDMILWREILGGVTDALYVKPKLDYQLADGFNLYGSVIYSRTLYAESAPSGRANDLGLEVNAGAKYETEDGFHFELQWGMLFPLDGLRSSNVSDDTDLEAAQALRAKIGIKF